MEQPKKITIVEKHGKPSSDDELPDVCQVRESHEDYVGLVREDMYDIDTIYDLAEHEKLSFESAKRRYNRHLKRIHEIFGVPAGG